MVSRRSPRSTRTVLLILMAILGLGFALSQASAMGQKEDALAPARSLLEAKRFDEAITFLTDFIQRNPDRFDEAQKLLKKVILARDEYNRTGQELLKTIQSDPENYAKQLDLIEKLKVLDPHPNQAASDSIVTFKKTAAFVQYQREFDKIFAEARNLTAQARYGEAATAYAGGFKYYREEFDAGKSDGITKNLVATTVDRIQVDVGAYAAVQAELSGAADALKAMLEGGDAQGAADAWPGFRDLMVERDQRRLAIIQAGNLLSVQYDNQRKQDPEVTDASFLPFAFRFTLGRPEAADPEGILGTMEVQWTRILEGLQGAFETRLKAEYARGIGLYAAGDLTGAADALEAVSALAEPGLSVMSLWGLYGAGTAYPDLTRFGQTVGPGKPADYAADQGLAAVAAALARTARNLAQSGTTRTVAQAFAAGLKPDAPLAPSLATLSASRSALIDLEGRLDGEDRGLGLLQATATAWRDQGLGSDPTDQAEADLAAKLKAAKAAILADETTVASLAYGLEEASLEGEVAAIRALVASAKGLLDGTQDAAGVVLKYPGRSATALLAQGQKLQDLRTRLAGYTKRAAGEAPRLAASPEIQAWVAKGRALEEGAAGIEAERAASLAKAQDQKRLADSARQEAEKRVEEARKALAAQQFDTADDRLKKAENSYLDSFALEENPDLRASWDATNRRLAADIGTARRTKAQSDINKFLRDGKDLYFRDSYAKASDLFSQAKILRTTVFGVEDPEVEYWITLANAALSVSAGRVVNPTDPLYAEMSQLISLARTYYTQGQVLLNQRKTDDGKKALALAQAKINQVKVAFPQNQEAGTLALRIDQLLDPAGFPARLADKFSQLRAQLDRPSTSLLAQLQDLATLSPNYPGLQSAITQVKVGLNLIPAPLTAAEQQRAAIFIASAKRILDANNVNSFATGLEQINEAIKIYGRNQVPAECTAIKDRLLLALGDRAQAPLSAEAEQRYRQAVAEYASGNRFAALAICNQLLADPRNRNSAKIIDLKKKCEAVL